MFKGKVLVLWIKSLHFCVQPFAVGLRKFLWFPNIDPVLLTLQKSADSSTLARFCWVTQFKNLQAGRPRTRVLFTSSLYFWAFCISVLLQLIRLANLWPAAGSEGSEVFGPERLGTEETVTDMMWSVFCSAGIIQISWKHRNPQIIPPTPEPKPRREPRRSETFSSNENPNKTKLTFNWRNVLDQNRNRFCCSADSAAGLKVRTKTVKICQQKQV